LTRIKSILCYLAFKMIRLEEALARADELLGGTEGDA